MYQRLCLSCYSSCFKNFLSFLLFCNFKLLYLVQFSEPFQTFRARSSFKLNQSWWTWSSQNFSLKLELFMAINFWNFYDSHEWVWRPIALEYVMDRIFLELHIKQYTRYYVKQFTDVLILDSSQRISLASSLKVENYVNWIDVIIASSGTISPRENPRRRKKRTLLVVVLHVSVHFVCFYRFLSYR
jgi:hypothetical protein